MEAVSVEKKKRGRKRMYETGQRPSEIKKREKRMARLKMLNEANKQKGLAPTMLHGFRFGSFANKDEFEFTERKLEEANTILYDIHPTDYTRRNIQTHKRNKILYDLFSLVFKNRNHVAKFHNVCEEMKNHLIMLCEQSGQEYADYERMLMDEVEVDEYEGI